MNSLFKYIVLRETNYNIFQAECPHCKGKYSNLSQHIHKVHLKTKNVMCDKCGMTFYHNSNLKKHIESTHTQHKAIQTLNNNYLEDMDRQAYSPGYQPNYWTHYEQYNHNHTHYHYHYQNNYYGRQWWY